MISFHNLKIALSTALLVLLISGTAQASVYVYVTPDGSTLITDKRLSKKGYRLKKSYKTFGST